MKLNTLNNELPNAKSNNNSLNTLKIDKYKPYNLNALIFFEKPNFIEQIAIIKHRILQINGAELYGIKANNARFI